MHPSIDRAFDLTVGLTFGGVVRKSRGMELIVFGDNLLNIFTINTESPSAWWKYPLPLGATMSILNFGS